MLRIEMVALKEDSASLLRLLHEQGVVHIEPQTAVPSELGGRLAKVRLTVQDEKERLALEAVTQGVRKLLGALSPRATVTTPEIESTERLLSRFSEISGKLSELEARRQALKEEKRVLPHLGRLVSAFFSVKYAFERRADWSMLGLILDRAWEGDIETLRREMERVSHGRLELSLATLDPERLVAIVFYDQRHEAELEKLIYQKGIEHLSFPRKYLGRPLEEVLAEIAHRERAIDEEMEEAETAYRTALLEAAPELLSLREMAGHRLKELLAKTACLQSQYAVALSGWVPEARASALREVLHRELGDRVHVSIRRPHPSEWASVPVALANPRGAQPFEILLSPVRVPRYGTLDPTMLLALFFPVFFGIMVGDVGHGAILLLAGLGVRRFVRKWPRQISSLLWTMGGSAIVFGLLFGELFGDLGRPFLRPILFDRREKMIPFLYLSLAIGVAHVVLGFVLGIVGAARLGEHRRVAERAATLLAIFGGLALLGAATRILPAGWFTPALVLMLAMVPILIYAGGFLALIELISTAGHILSYARLMALGLAGAMLAHVANSLGSKLGNVVLGVLVAVMLHVLNLAMSLFSPTIQALRLHYVEFFSKFYESGSVPYHPFRKSETQEGG